MLKSTQACAGRGRQTSGLSDGSVSVSSHGGVRHASGNVTTGCVRLDGSCMERVKFHDSRRHARVHRLVAHSFFDSPPTPAHCYVNNQDGLKSNNHMSNLEWVTASQNAKHALDRISARESLQHRHPF
mmetsp:Transcript_39581/g.126898  ORF Transcript_39581/g.126898 Transcript_39581/m.126898 type:complete len:128 (-) Transcript_39581:266-649(-)